MQNMKPTRPFGPLIPPIILECLLKSAKWSPEPQYELLKWAPIKLLGKQGLIPTVYPGKEVSADLPAVCCSPLPGLTACCFVFRFTSSCSVKIIGLFYTPRTTMHYRLLTIIWEPPLICLKIWINRFYREMLIFLANYFWILGAHWCSKDSKLHVIY